MSQNALIILAGLLLFLFGLAKTGGFRLSNIGINIGSTNRQSIDVSAPAPTGKPGRDWIGLAASAIGLATALFGLVNSLIAK